MYMRKFQRNLVHDNVYHLYIWIKFRFLPTILLCNTLDCMLLWSFNFPHLFHIWTHFISLVLVACVAASAAYSRPISWNSFNISVPRAILSDHLIDEDYSNLTARFWRWRRFYSTSWPILIWTEYELISIARKGQIQKYERKGDKPITDVRSDIGIINHCFQHVNFLYLHFYIWIWKCLPF